MSGTSGKGLRLEGISMYIDSVILWEIYFIELTYKT